MKYVSFGLARVLYRLMSTGLLLWMCVMAAPALAEPVTPDGLSQLERQVFGVVVAPAEAAESRMTRLEETVFGIASTGPLPERLDRLRSAVPSAPSPSIAETSRPPAQSASQPYAGQSNRSTSSTNLYDTPAGSPPPLFYDDPDQPTSAGQNGFSRRGGSQEGFMTSSRNQQGPTSYARPLDQSSGQYGGPSGSSSSTSTDATSDPYGQSTYTQSTTTNDLYGSGDAIDADMAGAVTNLEQKLFGQTYPAEPLEGRLSRLEVKFFNQPAPEGTSVEQRFDRLVTVAATDQKINEPSALQSGGFWSNALPVILMLLPLLL